MSTQVIAAVLFWLFLAGVTAALIINQVRAHKQGRTADAQPKHDPRRTYDDYIDDKDPHPSWSDEPQSVMSTQESEQLYVREQLMAARQFALTATDVDGIIIHPLKDLPQSVTHPAVLRRRFEDTAEDFDLVLEEMNRHKLHLRRTK